MDKLTRLSVQLNDSSKPFIIMSCLSVSDLTLILFYLILFYLVISIWTVVILYFSLIPRLVCQENFISRSALFPCIVFGSWISTFSFLSLDSSSISFRLPLLILPTLSVGSRDEMMSSGRRHLQLLFFDLLRLCLDLDSFSGTFFICKKRRRRGLFILTIFLCPLTPLSSTTVVLPYYSSLFLCFFSCFYFIFHFILFLFFQGSFTLFCLFIRLLSCAPIPPSWLVVSCLVL